MVAMAAAVGGSGAEGKATTDEGCAPPPDTPNLFLFFSLGRKAATATKGKKGLLF